MNERGAADKLEACDSALQHSRRVGTYMMEGDKRGKRGQEQQLQKICHDTNKVANEQMKGISAQVLLLGLLMSTSMICITPS